MNSHDVLRTAVKVGGACAASLLRGSGGRYCAVVPEQAKNTGFDFPVVSTLAALVVPMIFGLLLWLFPAAVANTIIKKDLPTKSEEAFLIGLEKNRDTDAWYLYNGITHFVSDYASFHHRPTGTQMSSLSESPHANR